MKKKYQNEEIKKKNPFKRKKKNKEETKNTIK